MKNKFDILKLVKLLGMLMLSLTLISCSGSGDDKDNNSVFGEGENVDEGQIEKDHATCWQENIIDMSYKVIGDSTIKIYDTMNTSSMPLMMIAFSIWFAFRMMIHVSSFTEEQIGEFWKEIFSQFIICFVCGLLASSTPLMMYTLNMTVFPIFNALLEFGSRMLAETSVMSTGSYDVGIAGIDMTFDKNDLICVPAQDSKYITDNKFPDSPKQMLGCMACSINTRLNIGITIALQALVNWNFISLITGLFVLAVFMIVKLSFVFSLVDSIFRMGIMVVILPILIMAYAFKTTRKWTKEGFLIMLSSGAFMAFISIIITLTLVAMEKLFSKGSIIFGDVTSDEFQGINLREFSATFLCLILISFLLVEAISIAKDVSNSLVGGGANDKFAQKLKGLVEALASFAIGLVSGGTSAIAKKALGSALKKGAEKIADKGASAVKSLTKD